ncbi:hypothetical protein ACSDR0_47920 [Streptosporangium sp. G11]|uniref:hypothetical protein n=1 Tax=Streptosporangium sp. G11 TaxID=3436926 RepID=UPI003EC05C25
MRSEQYGESGSEYILSFRVERYDALGNRILLVPVEMRGRTIHGGITEGDWVRVRGPSKDGTVRAAHVENVTTGATVRAKAIPTVVKIAVAVFFAAIVIFFIVTLVQILTAASSFHSGFESNDLPRSFIAGSQLTEFHPGPRAGLGPPIVEAWFL